ncbi:MAG: hypothetical protein FD153_1327 [Rhodospirillaceae bacterium]|nr:MAG: hypothetical protein FD153_1327 [Rhodospirillaceae bacterium]
MFVFAKHNNGYSPYNNQWKNTVPLVCNHLATSTEGNSARETTTAPDPSESMPSFIPTPVEGLALSSAPQASEAEAAAEGQAELPSVQEGPRNRDAES